MAGALPASTLLYEAADAEARRARLPSPRNIEIDHFVILMMENRSFDHYFGWAPGADASQRQSYRDPAGNAVPTRPASNLGANAQWKGCGYNDPGHGWKSGRAQLRGGFMAQGSGNDIFALTYYDKGQLGFIHQAASTYTLYDRYFCSLLGPTFPNRYYKWAATSAGKTSNIDQVDINKAGNQFETIFDRAIGRGLSARYYHSDQPFAAVYGPRGHGVVEPGLPLLRGLRRRHAAQHHDRRPAVRRRRRRGRALSRRAPAGRRAAGPGLHGRRGQRVRALAQLPPRRAVHRVRRVGRVLRPRPPAARTRQARHRQPGHRLRPDGLPHPRGGGLALHAPPHQGRPACAWTTGSTATSRSSS